MQPVKGICVNLALRSLRLPHAGNGSYGRRFHRDQLRLLAGRPETDTPEPRASESYRPHPYSDDRPLLVVQIRWRVSLPPADALPAAR